MTSGWQQAVDVMVPRKDGPPSLFMNPLVLLLCIACHLCLSFAASSSTPTHVLVHQTARAPPPSDDPLWQSWLTLGFTRRFANDTRCLEDILRLCRETKAEDVNDLPLITSPSVTTKLNGSTLLHPHSHCPFLRTYFALPLPVQRADFWRYAAVWLYGGVYADTDVAAHLPLMELSKDMFQTQSVAAIPTTQQNVETHSRKHFGILLFEEANDSYWTRFKQWVGLSTMVRAPQYRQSIFGARARHPAMLAAVQQITERMFAVSAGQQHPNMHFSYEEDRVRFTLELTGPGLFTDVCAAYVSDRGEHGARVITLDHVTEYFMHVHSGTWYEGGEGGWWDEVARLSGVFWLIVFCLLAIVVYTLRWIMGKFAGGVSLVSLWKHGYRAD